MKIKGFIKTTFIEYPGKIASMIFLPGCNFRCSFCFNPELVLDPESIKDVDEKEVFDFLEKQKKWIDAVVISGGEPMLHEDLPELARKIKKLGLLVRIYTNGTNPEMLKLLMKENLVDSIAMDIKAPLTEDDYERVTCAKGFLKDVKESISLIMKSEVDYEFRTTVVPNIITESDIEEIAKAIKGANLFVLQRFIPEKALDDKLKKLNTQSDEEMQRLADIARKHLKEVRWR
jgi:pyruvate formate lyase activating enzyme